MAFSHILRPYKIYSFQNCIYYTIIVESHHFLLLERMNKHEFSRHGGIPNDCFR